MSRKRKTKPVSSSVKEWNLVKKGLDMGYISDKGRVGLEGCDSNPSG